ncbi:hypothetical protein F5879DRAFT_1020002 [Lentinula edodes]|uniref:uncharacterized protein n=1 Tax=Lentinula edodes TaxID=5353 RepID=UPI001E8DAB81|nr:uncharacterized protein C8R40DRAFT_1167219 [Lentinula edodes]KAH7878482.1 hypothetical protein C8R40DRAFT_1167219 [Lentinula edodes]KAJ3908825.1 hypothetical protein F5879DRAFT_1020002 [Lentinula edodes]KAJ3918283.1 hypothetical protein F5877DRAFT_79167 [Lentinula edodes]
MVQKPARRSQPKIQDAGANGDVSGETEENSKLQLFTPRSNFYSRTLPPLGVRACNLNGANEINFEIDEHVLVRNFQEHALRWTEWIHGTVVAIDVVRGYIGSFAKRYIVQSMCTNGLAISAHLPFLYEIWPACCSAPSPLLASPEVYFKQRERLNYVFALLERTVHEESLMRVWIPARILKWERDEVSNKIEVQCLAGSDLEREFFVDQILPYTHETLSACRSQGDLVIEPEEFQSHILNHAA